MAATVLTACSTGSGISKISSTSIFGGLGGPTSTNAVVPGPLLLLLLLTGAPLLLLGALLLLLNRGLVGVGPVMSCGWQDKQTSSSSSSSGESSVQDRE